MKHFLKLLACLALVLCMVLCIAACGEDPTPTPGPDDKPGEGGDGDGGNTDIILENIYTRNIKFNDGEVLYDGELHTWERYTGKTDPERVDNRFEYWKDGVKVADGGVGVKDAGTYEVRLYFFADGYKETYVTATLTVVNSYNITYAVGDGLTLPSGTTVADILGKDSPTIYADNTKNLYLIDASLADYKFKGWYLDEACTNGISIINGAEMGSKDITLYAKFQPYLPYPKPYEYSTGVTQAPETLPAIPGYDNLPSDAATVLDMSLINSSDKDHSLGEKYQSPENDEYWFKFADAVTTAGGQPAIQWIDYNDTFDGLWNDDNTNFSAGDGIYNGSMSFYKPFSTDHTLYDTVEFWVYCANTTVTETNPDGDNIMLIMWTDGNDSKTLRYSIPLNFSGWKKFTLRVRDFKAIGTGNLNISRVSFFAYDIFGETATLSTNKDKNFIYFSNMFLTSHKSSYSTSGAIPQQESIKVLEAFEKLTITTPSLSDTEIAAVLSQVSTSGTGVFDDITVTDQVTMAQCYDRILALAEAWNCPTSTYYKSDDVLNAIGTTLNSASAFATSLLEYAVPLDESIQRCCLDLAKTMLIIGDHINATHAKTWLIPAEHYFPSGMGEGEDAFISAYIFTASQLALGNNGGAITGIYQMTHLLSKREISMNLNAADIVPLMTVLKAAHGTALYPVGNTFVNDLFAWFYECVDALTYEGKVPTGMEGSLVPFIRGMLLIYDLAPEATQAQFASLVKYYLAQDNTLKDALVSAQYYDIEATALAAIEASSATVASGTSASQINSALGQAIYKNDSFFFLLTKDGQLIVNGVTTDLAAEATTLFEGLATENTLAILTDYAQIIVDKDGVHVYESKGYYTDDSSEVVIIGAGDTNSNMADVEGLRFYETDTAVILLIQESDDTYTVTVNNYTGKDGIVTLYIDGDLEPVASELNVNFNYNFSDGNTKLEVDFSKIDGDVYTFTLTVYS